MNNMPAKKIPELAKTFGKAKAEFQKGKIEGEKELNEELFLLENKTIVNQETFEEICEQNYFINSDVMSCFYKSWFGNK